MEQDAFNDLPDSIIAHRILSELYAAEADDENAIKVAESGLELVRRAEQDRGHTLTQYAPAHPLLCSGSTSDSVLAAHRVRKAFNVILSTSLVSFFPPKHHARALRILDDVLAADPDNIPCIMGRAYVLQHVAKWEDAVALFGRAESLSRNGTSTRLRAREEEVWCHVQLGEVEMAEEALTALAGELDALDGSETDRARCWWRLGKCYELRSEKINRCFRDTGC